MPRKQVTETDAVAQSATQDEAAAAVRRVTRSAQEPVTRGEREKEPGEKRTVYLPASQVRHLAELEASGIRLKDVIARGFAHMPVSADGTVPAAQREAMEYIARIAAVMAAGGHVFTAGADPDAVLKALAQDSAK